MQGQESYRVMIVEDDQKIAGILAEELERYGMAVPLVEDCAGVKEAFCTNQPDLVLRWDLDGRLDVLKPSRWAWDKTAGL